MKLNKFYILGLIPLFFMLTIYFYLNSSSTKQSISHTPYTFSAKIGDPSNMVLVNLSTMPADKHPLSFSFSEKKTVSALVEDIKDIQVICDLYYNQPSYIIPYSEVRDKSNLFDKNGNSRIKYLVQMSASTDTLADSPHLMSGYINYNGDFIQYVEETNNDLTYIKGHFSKDDMKIIDSIYEKWYTHKLKNK